MLGRELAAAGLVVVSGLARGVDGEAHRGALEAGGTTVAVLGCGIDRDYPAAHAQLARGIARDGARRLRVRARRRARALALSGAEPHHRRARGGDGVVEARERSGALITADFALEEGREVFAVPGEITSALSSARTPCCALGATPLTSADDVLQSLGIDPAPASEIELGEDAAAVLAALAAESAAADQLGRLTGLDAAALASALTDLELAGAVVQADGLYRGVRPPD